MTNQEMVDKIVEKSGITREQAEQALEMHGGDLLEAMIYVERMYKTQGGQTSSSFSTAAQPQTSYQTEQPFAGSEQQTYTNANPGFNVNEQKKTGFDEKQFGVTLKQIVNFLVNNGITIHHNETELATIPIIVWIVVFFSSISSLVVLMFISMFFNVRYSFSGSELNNPTLNGAMSAMYAFVQNLKGRIFG